MTYTQALYVPDAILLLGSLGDRDAPLAISLTTPDGRVRQATVSTPSGRSNWVSEVLAALEWIRGFDLGPPLWWIADDRFAPWIQATCVPAIIDLRHFPLEGRASGGGHNVARAAIAFIVAPGCIVDTEATSEVPALTTASSDPWEVVTLLARSTDLGVLAQKAENRIDEFREARGALGAGLRQELEGQRAPALHHYERIGREGANPDLYPFLDSAISRASRPLLGAGPRVAVHLVASNARSRVPQRTRSWLRPFVRFARSSLSRFRKSVR